MSLKETFDRCSECGMSHAPGQNTLCSVGAATDSLHVRLDDALDDLPRYYSVSQPDNGWLAGESGGPLMKCCVSVVDVREMLRRVVLGGGER